MHFHVSLSASSVKGREKADLRRRRRFPATTNMDLAIDRALRYFCMPVHEILHVVKKHSTAPNMVIDRIGTRIN